MLFDIFSCILTFTFHEFSSCDEVSYQRFWASTHDKCPQWMQASETQSDQVKSLLNPNAWKIKLYLHSIEFYNIALTCIKVWQAIVKQERATTTKLGGPSGGRAFCDSAHHMSVHKIRSKYMNMSWSKRTSKPTMLITHWMTCRLTHIHFCNTHQQRIYETCAPGPILCSKNILF